MSNKRGQWVHTPPKPTVSPAFKQHVQKQANEFVETILKPEFVKSRPLEDEWKYLSDITAKWHGSFFYFCSIYTCTGPNALAPGFESKFARLEYKGEDKFSIAFFRHTGQWWELGSGLSLEDCFSMITDDSFLQP
ncbi:MAG: hypothetical protein ACKO85_02800 [Isosphaeraceae bacterium]